MNDRRALPSFRLVAFLASTALSSAALARGQTAPGETAPLTLRRAAELALVHAPQLAAQRASREEASASARVAADALHPSVWVSTTPGYSSGLPVSVAGSVPSYFTLTARQTIFDPARKYDALQAEAHSVDLEGIVESGCADTVRATVRAYARSWTDERDAEAARRRLAAAEAAQQRTVDLFEAGRVTEMDVERAKLATARAKQKLLNAESDRELDGLELKRLIGWPASAPLRLSSETESALRDEAAPDNLSVALQSDPQLKSLGRQIELLGQSARLSAKRWPTLEASVQYQRLPSYYSKYYSSFNENNFSVGVSVAIPIWSGGRLHDTEAKAHASVLRAEAERNARESDLAIAVRRAEASVARAEAEHSIARRSQGIAERDLSATEALMREGRGEAGALDDRRLQLADADEESARTALAALEERTNLLFLRGDLARAVLGEEPPCSAAPAR